jgi:ATP adenylyltransferase
MKQLWAPWRLEFILAEKGAECVFCHASRSSNDKENLVLHRGKGVFVILNKYPYNNGHLMVVPNEHTAEYTALPIEILTEMMSVSQLCLRVLGERFRCEGYNIGMNLGEAGGAGIRDHLHLHVVPRWKGDVNFMPVLAETKSMPQHLSACFDELQRYFRRVV